MSNIMVWKLAYTGLEFQLEQFTLETTPQSLNALTHYLPGGAYTTFRTYRNGKVIRFRDQIHRLEHSAELDGSPMALDEKSIRRALRVAWKEFRPRDEVRIRMTLDLVESPGTIYIVAEDLQTPTPEAYQRGMRVVTCDLRRRSPQAKLTDFIIQADVVRNELPPEVHEALMVDEQERILEGLSSNFFAVRNAEIWTEKHGVLSGITREVVIERALVEGFKVNFEPVRLPDISYLEEAFITSASRGVLPVTYIDGIAIGTGVPGKYTLRLMEMYTIYVNKEAHPL